jgi:hypothetical protein
MFGANRETRVGIDGEKFTINGDYTYEGVSHRGFDIEGLLFNSRMVQAIFDDENPDTRHLWAYPDTGEWDPERNADEFAEALPSWRERGLRAVTINLQGGCPVAYAKEQPWHVSAFHPDGTLKEAWRSRLEHVLDAADEAGVIVILGYFYFGQDQILENEDAVVAATRTVTEWLLEREYTNVLIQINNECDASEEDFDIAHTLTYEHDVLKPGRVHELINIVQEMERDGFSYPASTSFGGGSIPSDNVVAVSDFVLLHGNGVDDPERISEMVRSARQRPSYEPMPVLFNEDDHWRFHKYPNNMLVAITNYASWGYTNFGKSNYEEGYQAPPVNWGINTDRKRAFFDYLDAVTTPIEDGGT